MSAAHSFHIRLFITLGPCNSYLAGKNVLLRIEKSKRYRRLNFENDAMNKNESKAGSFIIKCPMNEMV